MCVRLNRASLSILLTLSGRELFETLILLSIITELTTPVVLLVVFLIGSTLLRLRALLRNIVVPLFRKFPFLVLRKPPLPPEVLFLLAMLSLLVSLPVRAFPAMWRETRPLLDLIGGATRKMKFYV